MLKDTLILGILTNLKFLLLKKEITLVGSIADNFWD